MIDTQKQCKYYAMNLKIRRIGAPLTLVLQATVGICWYCAEVSPNPAALLPFMTFDFIFMHPCTWWKVSREMWPISSPAPGSQLAQATSCSKGGSQVVWRWGKTLTTSS